MADVTITVVQGPNIASFTANPSSIYQGQSSTLSWTVTPAGAGTTTVSLDQDMGAQNGTWITVSPTATKTYTLTAASPYGTVTRGVTVAVNAIPPVPTISSFTASSSTLTVGQSALLSWSVAGADSLTLNGSPVTGTSITVTPSGTMTYTLVALNGGGQAQRSVKITVPNPEPPLAWVSDAVYGWGQLIFEKRGAQAVYQQGDHLGTPSVLTNASGTVMGRQKSLPFGERMVGSGAKSLRRFTNHEDGNQFPVYMQARMYLPTYGRFAQVDPAYDHSADGLNLYSYVSNEPVTRTDPDGMRDVGFFGGGGGGGGDQWAHVPQDLRADMWAGEFRGLDFKFAGDLGIISYLTSDGVVHYTGITDPPRHEEESAASEAGQTITSNTEEGSGTVVFPTSVELQDSNTGNTNAFNNVNFVSQQTQKDGDPCADITTIPGVIGNVIAARNARIDAMPAPRINSRGTQIAVQALKPRPSAFARGAARLLGPWLGNLSMAAETANYSVKTNPTTEDQFNYGSNMVMGIVGTYGGIPGGIASIPYSIISWLYPRGYYGYVEDAGKNKIPAGYRR